MRSCPRHRQACTFAANSGGTTASKKHDADWQIGSTRTGRRGRVVLRITITDFPDEQRWSLAGRLVGRWAAELRSTWRERRRESDARRCVVDLNDVTFI